MTKQIFPFYFLLQERAKPILARFKQNANPARKQAHARYKKWTSDTRQKQIAGFTASLRARTGDDSFDQE